jgi:pimeloyl-ACP methyl ester carboxylesterase
MPPQAFTVTVPTLLLWAMNDAALLPSLLDGLDTWVPHLSVERIDGATHWVVHERPALVAECISRHLAT